MSARVVFLVRGGLASGAPIVQHSAGNFVCLDGGVAFACGLVVSWGGVAGRYGGGGLPLSCASACYPNTR